jgi:hypothetical protein
MQLYTLQGPSERGKKFYFRKKIPTTSIHVDDLLNCDFQINSREHKPLQLRAFTNFEKSEWIG